MIPPAQGTLSPSTFGQRKAQTAVNRVANQQVQTWSQTGKLLIITASGSDECVGTVKFPYPFIEQPIFTYGAALGVNQTYKPGSMPTISALVIGWDYIDGVNPAYTGATLGVTATNDPANSGMKLYLHYVFTGQATNFPAGAQPTNTTGTA